MSSCQRTPVEEVSADSETVDLAGIMIHSSNLPLFSDLSAYDRCSSTKSCIMDEDSLLSLESLLDRSREARDINGSYRVTCIPFREEYSSENVSLTSEAASFIPQDSLSRTAMFFVRTFDTEDNSSYDMVVTMIPDVECQERMVGKELSYFDKSEFSGLILYSDPDGTFLDAMYTRYYTPMLYAHPVISEASDDSTGDSGCSIYLSVGKASADTKCISKIPVWDEWKFRYDDEPTYTESGEGKSEGADTGCEEGGYIRGVRLIFIEIPVTIIDTWEIPGWESSTSDSYYQNNNYNYGNTLTTGKPNSKRKPDNQKRDTYQFNVQLSAKGGGSVCGSGIYPKGHRLVFNAIPDSDNHFSRWTGALSGQKNNDRIVVNSDISATAVFITNKLKGENEYIEKLEAALLKHYNEIPLVKSLLTLLNEYSSHLAEICITNNIETKDNRDVDGLTIKLSDGTYKIVLKQDSSSPSRVCAPAMYEEFLHVVQYCQEGTAWLAGDKELEAKVLDTILYLEYDMFFGVDKPYLIPFLNYYNNPSDQTYDAAVRALRGYPFFYSEAEFPITASRKHSERLKHIKH